MRRALVCVAVLAALCPPVSAADTVLQDDSGERLELEAPAERIVTLAPHLAELVFEVGAGGSLVGAVEWSDHPPAARDVPRVGNGFRVDVERVVSMQPDLVLAWGGGTPKNTIERLRDLDLPVAVLAPTDLKSIPRHLEWIGQATGNEVVAAASAKAFRQQLRSLRDTYARRETLNVFYQINDPLVFTIGGEHTITEAVATCGGENIFSDLPPGAHSISREDVIARNPDVVLIGSHDEARYASTNWQQWDQLRAVRAGNVMVIDAALLARAAPRIVEGVRRVCRLLEKARSNLESKPG